jgi:RimJ/RimL family protein N-acetyltransferase
MDESILIQESILKDTLIENTIKELKQLNLSSKDYVNIANAILDLALNNKRFEALDGADYIKNTKTEFPVQYEEIIIEKFDPKLHRKLLKEWTSNEFGREFLLSGIDNIEMDPDVLIREKNNIFGIIQTKDRLPIGVMGYLHFDKLNNKAELRKLIGNRDYTGKGLGKMATKAWILYGLNNLKIRKIYIYTFDTNLRNLRINRELGFNLEGIFKAENLYNGTVRDVIRMTLIADNQVSESL